MRILINDKIKAMWLEYDKDLALYAGEKTKEEALKGLDSYDVREDCYYIEVTEGTDDPIGFLIIGVGESCHPDCDYYIAEAYIQKEHRRKGYMSKTVKGFFKDHPGIYCLDIYNKNSAAKKFWDQVFKKNGFIKIERPYIEHGINRKISDMYFYRN